MPTLIEFKNISKSFPGVQALDDVSISVERNTIHALVGENGAGKTTFIKICGGLEAKDSGDIFYKEKEVFVRNAHDAKKLGISIVHQHFPQCLKMTVAQNIFMPEYSETTLRLMNWKTINRKADVLLQNFGVDLAPEMPLKNLTIAQRQVVEICKAIAMDVDLIIMDEPTSALPLRELHSFFDIIKRLKESGMTIIYVSHKLDEIFSVADVITVLRDGKEVATVPKKDTTPSEIATIMVGRRIEEFERNTEAGKTAARAKTLLKVDGLKKGQILNNVSLDVKVGEIVGLAGLQGSGCSELLKAIFGFEQFEAGSIVLNGRKLEIGSSRAGIEAGIAYVPTDRHREGLNLIMSVGENIALAEFMKLSRMGILWKKNIESIGLKYIERLGIKTQSVWESVNYLSGGNQQKVVIGKWLATEPLLLLLDDPTRGVDVGAKAEIHKIVQSIVVEGRACIMTSSEFPELLSFCDRIVTMYKGSITGNFAAKEVTEDTIMHYITGAGETSVRG
ncbi:MAG: sugar ABC transporter ATP-binding protein [Spirochaetes bacterium]|nr:sugar ABC transporter ATP-binding protein [Spirochaetota bacterium]